MIDDKLGYEILKLLDKVRKKYGKSMQEKDRKELMDINKRLYDLIGGISKDPLQDPAFDPAAQSLGGGNYQVKSVRQAESIDLQRLARLVVERATPAK